MGFSSTACYRNEIGKVLAKLRVDYGENVTTQSKRLACNPSFITLVGNGKRGFTYDFYTRIFDCYGESAEKYRTILTTELIKPDIQERFAKAFPGATPEQMLFVLFGVEV